MLFLGEEVTKKSLFQTCQKHSNFPSTLSKGAQDRVNRVS